jgi:hypothetical protein
MASAAAASPLSTAVEITMLNAAGWICWKPAPMP